MFVGVVVENFHKCRQQQEEEEARLREEKRQRRLEKRRRSENGEMGCKGIYICIHIFINMNFLTLIFCSFGVCQ